ncbi:hypothetical protein [Maridesulfovibrio sp.]|uniref:hypothetical protein n=1 Tax=Maridesulfovibrio sp. TaxID=2795000 RepID=UPI0039EF7E36
MSKETIETFFQKHLGQNQYLVSADKYKFKAEDLVAFIVFTTAIYAFNYYLLSKYVQNYMFKDLAPELSLLINSSDINVGKYEKTIKLFFPYVSFLTSLLATALFFPFDIRKTNTKTSGTILTTYVVILALSTIAFYAYNFQLPTLFLFAVGLCYIVAQASPNILIAFTLINAIILTNFTVYNTQPEPSKNKNQPEKHSTQNTKNSIYIDIDGHLIHYELLMKTKNELIVRDIKENTFLIPISKINRIMFTQ